MAALDKALYDEIIRLRFVEHVAPRIIARRLNVSKGCVAGHIWRYRHPQETAAPPRLPAMFTILAATKLDDETEAELQAASRRFKTTRSETVRMLIEWGLEDVRRHFA